MSIHVQLLALALLSCLAHGAAAQVFKCTVNNETVYQQAPCETKGMKGAKLELRQAAPDIPVLPPPRQQADAPAPQVPVVAPASAQVAPPIIVKTQLEKEADACLEWYRPMLRDPNGAYYKGPSKEGRMVTMSLYATNGFGGYVNKTASCEFKDGRHDVDWTKIHAQRLGW